MSLKILVVDDEKDVELLFRQRFRKALKEGRLELSFAFSGESALDLLERSGTPDVALILSDINMPGMSGFTLLTRVKERFPQLKVMMITAYGDEQHAGRAQELGADAFLTKPVDFTALEELLSKMQSPSGS
jgi:CheY-like chemotaxis protein